MSEIADRYRTLSETFTTKVESVPPDRWESQTPCPDWTARQLLQHVVDTHGMFLGFVGRQLGVIPSSADDPLAAWRAARDRVQADLDDPAKADEGFESFSGPTTFAESVDRFLCFDQVIHGWDLAHATGLDETIPDDEIERITADVAAFGDAIRSRGACGPAIEPAPDADPQTQLLNLVGRRP
jgi:uncharacterized protein (TIGR03086 family)